MLEEEKINSSSISVSVKQSGDFKTLLNGKFIKYSQAVSGGGSYLLNDRDNLERYFKSKFPKELQDSYSAIGNIGTFRNTKVGKRTSQNVILVRGFKNVLINSKFVELEHFTSQFGTFSVQVNELETDRICIVENLDSFLLAEKVIGKDFVFIHTYGGLGKSVLNKFKTKNVLIFPDYDFKGLQNYLMVKKVFSNTKLFIPSNYEELFKMYSRTTRTKQGREQNPTKEVKESVDENVIKIRTDIYKTKRFLEQQALFVKFQND
ncbi:hypothetical protein SAMN04487906_0487 [Zhouia amylolytica]|uniref:Wadjet protein JetD C-terminal domain-containing protein n=1 Tax=Zhouia amylolytica TaxID=376730 RepID=A0A1I6PUP7_9FLAO|nr:Wadjet anti-phage system protein JetD domain-containing protein [Zhouia amylolytica]SFS43957.1 hypothetical protein SAMN04487906_0487 [Zhouia amylolytica]